MLSQYIDLYHSRYFFLLMLTIHGVMMVVVWITQIPNWASFALSLCLVTSLLYQLRKVKRFSGLRYLKDDFWELVETNGEIYPAELRGNSYISSYFLILNFKLESQCRPASIFVCPDRVSPQHFRDLQIYLRKKCL